MTAHLTIDEAYYEAGNCSVDDLHVAVSKLSATTEEAFNDIKNEDWFTRVFDMITFSNKKDMRLATQIQNVAQAQEILIQLLVRLSARDQDLNELVEDAFSKIEKLSQQDLALAKALKKLETQFYLGISNEATLESLTEKEQSILGAILLELSSRYEFTSEAQQEYADLILSYLNIREETIDYKKAINHITDIAKKKLLLQISLEYIYLYNGDFDNNIRTQEVLVEFDFGKKTVNTIKEKIQGIYKLRGIEGIFNRLNVEALTPAFEVENLNVAHTHFIEREEVTYKEMINVKADKELVIENKFVTIDTFINIEGKLTFKNCLINYDLSETIKGITVLPSGTLNFENCEINCEKTFAFTEEEELLFEKYENEDEDEDTILESLRVLDEDAIPESYLVKVTKGQVVFNHCNLSQCFNLVKQNDESTVNFINSYFINPQAFLVYNAEYKGKAEILNSTFVNDEVTEDLIIGTLIQTGEIKLTNSKVIFSKELMENVREMSDYHDELFEATKLEITSCEFENVTNGFVVKKITEQYSEQFEVTVKGNKFKNCLELFKVYAGAKCLIDENLFVEGSRFFIRGPFTIVNSIFKSCKNEILSAILREMSYCEFSDLKSEQNTNIFNIITGSYFDTTEISKCIFNGLSLDQGFLVAGNVEGKVRRECIEITECEFKNCYTNRKSKKILKEYADYINIFGSIKETKPLAFWNCYGLEDVKIQSTHPIEQTVDDNLEKNIKFGLVATGVVGVTTAVGGPIGMALGLYGVNKLLKDDSLTQE